MISRTDGKLTLGAHSVKRVAHGLNVLGLETETTGSRSWHRGATDVRSGAARGQRMCDYLNREGPDPKGKCLGPGPTQGQRRLTLRDQLRVSPVCNEIPYLRGYRSHRAVAYAGVSTARRSLPRRRWALGPPPVSGRGRSSRLLRWQQCLSSLAVLRFSTSCQSLGGLLTPGSPGYLQNLREPRQWSIQPQWSQQ